MSAIERRGVSAGANAWEWPDGLHPVLRQVLSRRPLSSPAELELELKHLVPVGRFDALQAGIELMLAHRHRRIVVVGDFDADGATSTALMLLALEDLGFAHVDYFIPDRFALGYGLSPGAVARLESLQPSLVVTVDNGISSHEGVEAARADGLDVLVTDHHLPPEQLPDANVIINPNLAGDRFPGKNLAGVGVAFYLLAGLSRALDRGSAVSAYLDLVALGTVADLVPLDFLNRILVEQGLRRIRSGRCRPGIRALAELAGADLRDMTTATLGYQLGPRLNAAGRLDDMSVGVRCLLSRSEDEARELAAELDRLNKARREIEGRMKAEAIDIVDDVQREISVALPPAICLRREDWHEGLVGLVASRVKERYHRPTFAFAPADGGALKGSGRSIPGLHLRDALAEVDALEPGLIERFGGHAMAAGLTIAADAFDRFDSAIKAVTLRRLESDALDKKVLSDGALHPRDMSITVAALLRDAVPWGQGFPEPLFDGHFELIDSRVLKGLHLKMKLRPADGGDAIDAIAFHQADVEWTPGAVRHLAYRLAINDYYSPASVQLIVEHIADQE